MPAVVGLTVVVEPDRQRLARFVMDAISRLGGNIFVAGPSLSEALERLRSDAANAPEPLSVELCLEDQALWLRWAERRERVVSLPEPPAAEVLTDVSEDLKRASDLADPELLRRRNESIEAELERSMERAAEEMASLQALLDRKKHELRESIRLAETDGLTGLYNRGAYDSKLTEAVLRCNRQGEPLTLILLDLDHFKEINDTHGHQHGDRYLQRMAESIRAAAREHVDHPCRMGGDEFAVIAFAPLSIAHIIARRVLEAMDRKVSIGVAALELDDSISALVARADSALYQAKRAGRGRIVIASETRPRLKAEQGA